MRTLLTHTAFCLPLLACTQTYFYINSITVNPASPTTDDEITISLQGDLSSTGAYIISSSATQEGSSIQVNIAAADPGGFTVLVGHTEEIVVGQLAAGSYTIVVNGTNVWDMAPQPQHLFTVTEATSVAEVQHAEDVRISTQQGRLSVTALDGNALGTMEVIDACGRTLARERTGASTFDMLLTGAPGYYLVRMHERGLVRRVMW